jgi:hypothetical protein
MPFANYLNFDDCVEQNADKEDPKAYCAEIMRRVEHKMAYAELVALAEQLLGVQKYHEGQPRDQHGRWTPLISAGMRWLTGKEDAPRQEEGHWLLPRHDRKYAVHVRPHSHPHQVQAAAQETSTPAVEPDTQAVQPEHVVKDEETETKFYAETLMKADDAKRYTFSVVYKSSPRAFDDPVLDAHNEFATPDELFDARVSYVQGGDRNIYRQHGMLPGVGMKKIGEWVDIVQWPYDVEAQFMLPDGTVETRTIPKDSVYMGVIWEPDAWDLVKAGAIRGFSFGGKAKRLVVS